MKKLLNSLVLVLLTVSMSATMAAGVANDSTPEYLKIQTQILDMALDIGAGCADMPCLVIIKPTWPQGNHNVFSEREYMFGEGLVATPDRSPGLIHSFGDDDAAISAGFNYLDYGMTVAEKSYLTGSKLAGIMPYGGFIALSG
jgi:hypothetical protein